MQMPNTQPDFRQLCTELVEDVRYLSECLRDPDNGVDPVCLSEAEAHMQEARAALAAEQQGPTDEEIGELIWQHTTSTGHGERLNEMGFARALLARYGRQP
jgi:hypothetical protein